MGPVSFVCFFTASNAASFIQKSPRPTPIFAHAIVCIIAEVSTLWPVKPACSAEYETCSASAGHGKTGPGL